MNQDKQELLELVDSAQEVANQMSAYFKGRDVMAIALALIGHKLILDKIDTDIWMQAQAFADQFTRETQHMSEYN